MQKVIIESTTSITAGKVWSLLTDIENYPKYVKFVTAIKNPPVAFKEGVYWTDITNIVWIPLSVKHKIIKIERNKKFVYEVFLPFGGKMVEECELTANKRGTYVRSRIEFTLGNYFLDFIFGGILKKRLKKMLEVTCRNLEATSRS